MKRDTGWRPQAVLGGLLLAAWVIVLVMVSGSMGAVS